MQYGPKIVTDGLVLCLDSAEVNSYAGEPTTNNLDSSDRANANTGPDVSNNFGSIAITKEVVNYSSDRPHVYRFKSTNATGYVSIGYDSTIQNQSGSVYAFSFDYKVVRADSGTTTNLNTANMTVYGNGYKNPSSGTTASNLTSSEVELSDGWKRVTKTYTCGYTGYNQTRQDLNTGGVGDFEVLIDNIQFEDKTYSTPFADLSRSATDAWIDRSGNSSHGDFYNGLGTSTSHYRDSQVIMPVANSYLDFDGTNDSIVIDDVSNISLTSGSVEAWVKMDSISGNRVIVAYGGNGTNTGWLLQSENQTANKIGFLVFGAASAYSGNTLSTGYLNNWTHFVGTYGGGAVKFYANGTLVTSTATGTNVSSSSTLRIGNEYNRSYFLDGQLGLVRIYSKTLTAAEVLSNYNATKSRF